MLKSARNLLKNGIKCYGFKKVHNNMVKRSRRKIVAAATVGTGLLIVTRYLHNTRPNSMRPKEDESRRILPDKSSANEHLQNRQPAYIEPEHVENLISWPRFQNVLILIKLYQRAPNRENKQKLIHELVKLCECEISPSLEGSSASSTSLNELEELIRTKILKKPFASKRDRNAFLNNGVADYLSQLLDENFMIELAFAAPNVDERFFRIEPPSTIGKLNRLFDSDSTSDGAEFSSEYFLLFEFVNNFVKKIESNNAEVKVYHQNRDLMKLAHKLSGEMNTLIISEYFLGNRAKLNVWSDMLDDEEADEESSAKKINTLKEKIKQDFIARNESLVLSIIDQMVRSNLDEFIRLGGLEYLLLIYEKHKNNTDILNIIGNYLCLASLNPANARLFVQSGWLKRLVRMLQSEPNDANEPASVDLARELIAHKILFNLNQHQRANMDNRLYYSTMVYPLYPLYTAALGQADHLLDFDQNSANHQHVIDIIFVHGLKGSLFKTWRIDDAYKDKKNIADKDTATGADSANLMDKINNLISRHLSTYSYCWPKDWLPLDLTNKIKLFEDYEDNDGIHKYRIIGINYDSLYSLWGEELADDKKLKLSIKQRSLDLAEQLKLARVGNRPIVWVCHSMGGLIVKQMLTSQLLHKSGDDRLVKNTKGIVFLSTPHLGSNIAKTATKFSFALNPSTEVIELSTNSKYLVELNRDFLQLMRRPCTKMDILSLVENLPTNIGFNLYTKTVPESSANIGVGEFYLIDECDHLNICKPRNRQAFTYLKITDLINRLIRVENLNCEQCKIEYLHDKNKLLIEHYYENLKLNYFY